MADSNGPQECSHPRARYIVASESTEQQEDTEEEVAPFFVQLDKLHVSELDHLRQEGFLSSHHSSSGVTISGSGACLFHDDDKVGGSDESNALKIQLLRQKHIQYLTKALEQPLGAGFISLDASKPWMIYWTLHSLDLLQGLPSVHTLERIIDTTQRCFTLEEQKDVRASLKKPIDDTTLPPGQGGYGGGPQQLGHTAPTYAAVLSLCILAGAEKCVDGPVPQFIREKATQELVRVRSSLYRWFYSLRHTTNIVTDKETGHKRRLTGFRVHHDGEVDVRGTYTVVSVCALLNLLTDELLENVSDYVIACQTYEGGFSAEPHHGGEAHGGYAFCAIATLVLLGQLHQIDIDGLRGWLARRQCSFEGGFSGRSNKLVDGCYSFWQGSSVALLNLHDAGLARDFSRSQLVNCTGSSECEREGKPPVLAHGIDTEPVLEIGGVDGATADAFDLDMVVDAANNADAGGLMFDQGMLQRYIALCAQDPSGGLRDKPSKPRDFYHSCYNLSGWSVSQHVLSSNGIPVLWGHPHQNRLGPTHPTINIELSKVETVQSFFHNKVPRTNPKSCPDNTFVSNHSELIKG